MAQEAQKRSLVSAALRLQRNRLPDTPSCRWHVALRSGSQRGAAQC
eukprot:COSAG06_NODE_65525_length_256_cov_5.471338_1_plen_45_part_10